MLEKAWGSRSDRAASNPESPETHQCSPGQVTKLLWATVPRYQIRLVWIIHWSVKKKKIPPQTSWTKQPPFYEVHGFQQGTAGIDCLCSTRLTLQLGKLKWLEVVAHLEPGMTWTLSTRLPGSWARMTRGLGLTMAAEGCIYMWSLYRAWASHGRVAGIQGVLEWSMRSKRGSSTAS